LSLARGRGAPPDGRKRATVTLAGRMDSVAVISAHRPILVPVRISGVMDGARPSKDEMLTSTKPT
jgi:hypothetical protein